MHTLEKILEEIDKATDEYGMVDYINDEPVISKNQAKEIIRKHMNDNSLRAECSGRQWYQIGYKDEKNDGWIPVEERLPEDGTEVIATDRSGEVWGGLIYGYPDGADTEMCFHKWDNEYWQCYKPDVIAWQPLPEPYRPEQPDTCKYTGGSCCWPIDQCGECPKNQERSDSHDGESSFN